MIRVPEQLVQRYAAVLECRGVAVEERTYYIMWLRFYLDFCAKYPIKGSDAERVRLFLAKLGEKKQPDKRRRQAAHAVSLYHDMHRSVHAPGEVADSPQEPPGQPSYASPDLPRASQYCEAGYEVTSCSPEWDEVLARLAGEIKVRHYSRKTLKTYAKWSRQFQRFLKNKSPAELSTDDVKEYLTHLAVKCHVAASTQNQAFNALLFLYRHALKREFGELRGVPRAEKSLYVPMVLSRQEIDSISRELAHPYRLVVGLLFGCGLRLFECLQLRGGDFNFDVGFLTVHGKGKKDRTVPLPQTLLPALKAQIEAMARQHDEDLATGYDGVFLDDALERKFPKAAKELIHQWFFPQSSLTLLVSCAVSCI